MKQSVALFLTIITGVLALPGAQFVLERPHEQPQQLPLTRPGFSLNLEELRLVQFSDSEEPQWVTEFEKVNSSRQYTS